MATAELTRDMETEPTAQDTYTELLSRWQDYQPGLTEMRLGITYTSPDAVRLDRLRIQAGHKLLVMNETVQPSNNFKFNGAAEALRRKLAVNPNLRRIYIGSAGNAAAGYVAATEYYNQKLPSDVQSSLRLEVIVETPTSLVPSKYSLLAKPHCTVNPDHQFVEDATTAARQKAELDLYGEFVHAYNDLDAIAGQGFVAKRAFQSLVAMEKRGDLDLDDTDIKVLVQRGGGSLLTGFACELYRLKQEGILGDNVQLYQVCPVESVEYYDGLHVKTPGSYAQSVIDNPEFVAGTITVSDIHTSKAANAMAHTYHKPFEPSGLAGVGGFYAQQEKDNSTVYLTVLSGANYCPKSYSYFRDLSRRQEAKIIGSLVSEEYVDIDVVEEYVPPRGLNPCDYGRYPASK